jgi:tRNA pseudouridine(55) synthase
MIILYKNRGETPLLALDRLRLERPELIAETLSYAGRLDPMAEGLLLVLVGTEENKRRQEFLALDKEYEVEAVIGIGSDTDDPLGIIDLSFMEKLHDNEFVKERIEVFIKTIQGKRNMKYPAYSSKPFRGKPLFQWAREGRLDEIPEKEFPERKVIIHEAQLVGIEFKSIQQISSDALVAIGNVKGDFRQVEAAASWQRLAHLYGDIFLPCCQMKIKAGSGTYMRSIAHLLGDFLGTKTIAFKIKRTKINSSLFLT